MTKQNWVDQPGDADALRRARTVVIAPLTLREGDYKRKAGKDMLTEAMLLNALKKCAWNTIQKPSTLLQTTSIHGITNRI